MAFPTRNSVIWGEQESTYGAIPSPPPGEADAILCVGEPVLQPQLELLASEERPGTLGQHQSHGGKQWSKLTFGTLLRSSGSAHATGGTEPRLGKWLEACGFTKSAGGADPYGYFNYVLSSDWSAHKSMYVYGWYGGDEGGGSDTVFYKLAGARGTFSFSSTAGEIPKFDFVFNGRYTATALDTWPSPVGTFETTTPMVALNVEWGGLDGTMLANTAFLEFNFDMGSEPAMSDSAGMATGVDKAYITKWEVKGNLILQANPTMIVTLETELKARTGKALQVNFQQSDDINEHFIIKFANLMWENPYELGDKDGIRVVNMPFTAFESSGDDTIELQFGDSTMH